MTNWKIEPNYEKHIAHIVSPRDEIIGTYSFDHPTKSLENIGNGLQRMWESGLIEHKDFIMLKEQARKKYYNINIETMKNLGNSGIFDLDPDDDYVPTTRSWVDMMKDAHKPTIGLRTLSR